MEEKSEEEKKQEVEDLEKEENEKKEDSKKLEKEDKKEETEEDSSKKLEKEDKKEKNSKEKKKKENHKNYQEEIKKINIASRNFTDKIRKNPWIVSTIVLGILVLIYLIGSFSSTGNVISEKNAGEIVLGFVNSQVDGNVSIINITQDSGLYEVLVSFNEKEIPIYLTEDGKKLVQGVIPLDVLQQAQQQQTQKPEPTEVPKSDKPKVELFVMSFCPYGTQSEKGMLPVFELLGNKIDSSVKFVYYSMHGEKEVKEQLNQYCIQKEQGDKYYSYLRCFLNDSNSTKCLTENKIDESKLKLCTDKADAEFDITKNLEDKNSWLNGRFPKFDIYKDLNEQYEIAGSPTLVINGVQSNAGRDSASYLDAICQAFNNAPEECGTNLSSVSPSPGFGWKESSGSTGGQCA